MQKTCPTPTPFRGRVVWSVAFVTLVFFVPFLGRFIFPPLMPTISTDIGMTPGEVGGVFLVGSLGVLAGSVLSGFVAVRIAHRGALLVAAFGVVAALVLGALADSVWALGGVLLLLGVFSGLNQPSVVATITAMVRREDWGKALAVQQVAPPLSLVLGPLLAVALLSIVSWRVGLVVVALLVAAVGAALLAVKGLADFPGDPPGPRLVVSILRGRSFWVMVLLFALGMGAQVGVYTMLPLYLTGEKGMDLGTANTLLGVANLPPLAMAFVAGWVTSRVGEIRAMVGALLATGAVTFLVGVLDGVALTAAVLVLPAFAVCFFPPAFAALARTVQPGLRSVVAALAPPLAFIVGGGLLPSWLGYMGEHHTFGLGIALTGGAVMIGSFAAVLLRLLSDQEIEDGC